MLAWVHIFPWEWIWAFRCTLLKARYCCIIVITYNWLLKSSVGRFITSRNGFDRANIINTSLSPPIIQVFVANGVYFVPPLRLRSPDSLAWTTWFGIFKSNLISLYTTFVIRLIDFEKLGSLPYLATNFETRVRATFLVYKHAKSGQLTICWQVSFQLLPCKKLNLYLCDFNSILYILDIQPKGEPWKVTLLYRCEFWIFMS